MNGLRRTATPLGRSLDRPIVRAVVALGSVLAAAVGCRSPARPAPSPPVDKAGNVEPVTPVPNLEPSSLSTLAPEATEPVWQRAVRGDPMDLERLAVREGAQGLMDWVREGGTMGRAALAALPFAGDAEGATRELCDYSGRAQGETKRVLLRAVHAILTRQAPLGERLDFEGEQRCRRVLDRLARDPAEEPSVRDLAESARLALQNGQKSRTR